MSSETVTEPAPTPATKSRGFWSEAVLRFRRRKLAMAALGFILFLTLVAIFSPFIVGTKPIVCKYKGHIYFPCMGYFRPQWENTVFYRDKFRRNYAQNLKEKDPDSWAIWPLVYQDPYRRIREEEWPGQPENPTIREIDRAAPNRYNLMGVDQFGIDVFARMVHGTRIALSVGFIATGIAAIIGITVGAIAGFMGGWVDTLLSRLIEVVMCIPTLVILLAMMAIIEDRTIWHVMVVLGVTGWTSMARLTRAEFLKLRGSEFVIAATAVGASRPRIIFRHILPNALAPVIVPITFGIASAILLEASLSFLGFGTPPPNPSWGTILSQGRTNLEMWWLTFFPGMAIFLTVLCYNLVGEGVQEATDPRLRQAGK